MISAPALDGVTGLRLEALNHRDLPHNGPGRSRLGTWGINELEAFVKKPDGKDWEKLKLVNATADFSEPEKKQPDGKKVSGPVAHLIDGKDDTTWNADRGVGRRNQPSVAVVQFEQPLQSAGRNATEDRLADDRHAGLLPLQHHPAAGSRGAAGQSCRDAGAADAGRGADARTERRHLRRLACQRRRGEADQRRDRRPVEHVSRKRPRRSCTWPNGNRPTAARRICWIAATGTSRCTSSSRTRRPRFILSPRICRAIGWAFARWLTDPRSPLTARVAVNRDLAVDLRRGAGRDGGGFRHAGAGPRISRAARLAGRRFHGAGLEPEAFDSDDRHQRHVSAIVGGRPQSCWSAIRATSGWRGPRFRADAEVVRDIALSVSGLITHKLGGPSVIPPVPQNVLDYNFTYPAYWKPAEGPERYRRALYGFRKRSMPDPVMSNFDAPNGDFACARRVRSNTPLAALTGLNEPIFVEAARALALRSAARRGDG